MTVAPTTSAPIALSPIAPKAAVLNLTVYSILKEMKQFPELEPQVRSFKDHQVSFIILMELEP
jgi:hypothetical protein